MSPCGRRLGRQWCDFHVVNGIGVVRFLAGCGERELIRARLVVIPWASSCDLSSYDRCPVIIHCLPAAGLSAALPLLCVQGGPQHSAPTRCSLTSGAAPQQQAVHSGMPIANSTPRLRGLRHLKGSSPSQVKQQQHCCWARGGFGPSCGSA